MTGRLIRSFLTQLRPPERLSVSEFARRHYVIPRGNVEAGAFNPLPYQTDILDGFTDSSVDEHIICGPVQSSKTTLFTVFIAYLMALEPCNILVKYPTQDQAETFGRVQLGGIMDEMPVLRGLVSSNKQRDGTNTLSLKKFRGGEIRFRGQIPTGLRGYPSRVVIQDEISSDTPTDEGSSIDLADNRAESYGSRSIKIKASTPKLLGSCEIWKRLENTDHNKFFIPCPHCGGFHSLEWENVKWDKSVEGNKSVHHPETAYLVCPDCSQPYGDNDRIKGIQKGKWLATRPENKGNGKRGYHLNALYRLIGEKTNYRNLLHRLASEWLDAKREGPVSIQGFVNNQLALPFEQAGEKINETDLLTRGESYSPTDLPAEIQKIILSVDVQGDRLEAEVCGYDENENSWGIQYKTFAGNPRYPEIWNDLTNFISESRFITKTGIVKGIDVTFVDVGWGELAETVSRYCSANISRNVWAVKGKEVAGNRNVPPLIESTPSTDKHGLPFFWMGTRAAKETIYTRLNLVDKNKNGYCHFPIGYGYDAVYFQKLTAERRVVKWEAGKPYFTFINPTKKRNEPLDLRTMGLAAYRKSKGWANPFLSVQVKTEGAKGVPAFRPMVLNYGRGRVRI